MIVRALLAAVLSGIVVYGVYEIRRWSTPEGRAFFSHRQRVLRAWGLFCLIAALSLWLRGTWLPEPRTKQALLQYVEYWLLTGLMTLPCIVLAIIDARINMRRISEEERQLAQERAHLYESVDPHEP